MKINALYISKSIHNHPDLSQLFYDWKIISLKGKQVYHNPAENKKVEHLSLSTGHTEVFKQVTDDISTIYLNLENIIWKEYVDILNHMYLAIGTKNIAVKMFLGNVFYNIT